jgi:hypothetical protein
MLNIIYTLTIPGGHLMNKLLFIGLLLVSIPLFANETNTCSLELKEYRIGPDCHGDTNINVSIEVSSWETCYKEAIKLSKKYKQMIEVEGVIDKPLRCNTTIGHWTDFMYVDWEFNDGYFDDSDGQVSSSTSSFDEGPRLGNRAVDINGYFYF